MRWRAGIFGTLLIACSPPQGAARPEPLCTGPGVRVSGSFEQAGIASCTINDKGDVTARIEPEIRPVNPSPWYALAVHAEAAASRRVTLDYGDAAHRYWPWVKPDAAPWQRLTAKDIKPDGMSRVTLTLPAYKGRLIVAAQPFGGMNDADGPWIARGFAKRNIGTTGDCRPLVAWLNKPSGAQGLVVLTARQHPPERTGAWAYDSFINRLSDKEDAAARAFRDRYAVLTVPTANPDGLARGHWRGNATGADTNRDWGSFTQPETRAIADAIKQAAGDLPVAAIIDFHSTDKNVIYAPPSNAGRNDLGERFVSAFAGTAAGPRFAVSRSHKAGSGTLKGWALDQYGISGLTFEVDDITLPQEAAGYGARAAEALIAAGTGATIAPVAAAADALPVPPALAARGIQRFRFFGKPGSGWAGPSLPIWYFRPPGSRADAPVLFVFHGVGRDADRYIGEWIDVATKAGVIVVVPEFGREDFPGARGYNHGNIVTEDGKAVPRDRWTFAVLEAAFDAIVAREQLSATTYQLFGHSAGAQFVHRFVLTGGGARMTRAISANAGSYAFPTTDVAWPFGLGSLPAGLWNPAKAFATPMTILLGTADNDPNYPSLPRDPEAMAQGPHRLARGHAFYAAAKDGAAKAGTAFNWGCGLAPGIGHDNGGIAPFAMAIVTGKTVPAPGKACAPITPMK